MKPPCDGLGGRLAARPQAEKQAPTLAQSAPPNAITTRAGTGAGGSHQLIQTGRGPPPFAVAMRLRLNAIRLQSGFQR